MYYKYYIGVKNQINILQELINIIIKLNNQLYECRLKKNPRQKNYISQKRSSYNCQTHNYQNYRDFMEFDATKQ